MSKDTSYLINRKFKPVGKDRLFYDQFEYCLSFYLDEVSCLRELDHACIDDLIERRKRWREVAQQRWSKAGATAGTILTRRWKDITEQTVSDLHALAAVLLNTHVTFKLVVSVNQAYVYTNDLDLIDQLDRMPELSYKYYTQAQICRPKDTITLRNIRHPLRTYFKTLSLSIKDKENLEQFLYNHRDAIRISPALQRWVDQPFLRIQDYFFIDHDSESWLTMLNLVVPGLVRKTMHIIPAK